MAEDIIVTFRCPLDVKKKLDSKAEKSGKTLSAIVLSYVELGLSDETMNYQPGELRAIIQSFEVSRREKLERLAALKGEARRRGSTKRVQKLKR